MSLRVYNTLTREKEIFRPVNPGKVGIYLCGPTVYKAPHIGHMVGPVIFDAIKRYLKFKGFEVTWVVNITDVDDKLIEAATRQKTTVEELAGRYTQEYMECLALLGIDSIDRFPKATEHMHEIINLCSGLIGKGCAYAAEGNVYFDVTKDPDYGKLSHRKVEQQETGLRAIESGRQTQSRGLCPVESRQARRASVGFALGQGPPGLAYRVLGHVHEIPGPDPWICTVAAWT